jgi:hypothetical protein
VAQLPGVQSVSHATGIPLDGSGGAVPVFAEDAPAELRRTPVAEFAVIGPGWFATLNTPIVDGREFVPADSAGPVDVVIINEVLARRLWPGQSAVGRRVRIGSATGSAALVIGVARPSRYRTLGETARPALWRSLLRSPRSRTTMLVRTADDERALIPLVQSLMREIDPSLPVVGLGTLRDHVSTAYSAVRGAAVATAGFGVLATLLAAAGIYGVIAYGVAQRRREIGIRMALGAGRGAVVRLSVTRILSLTLAGAAVGLAVVLVVPLGLDALLLGVSARDPLTLAGAVLLFVVTAVLAAAAPARRAAGLEPMHVLRLD